jgi:hypothetical protein
MNQEKLIACYKGYLEAKPQIFIQTVHNFSGWIGRIESYSGRVEGEFHLKGKYFGFYGDTEPEAEERYFLEDKKVVIFEAPYKGYHWHLSVIHPNESFLTLENNVLFHKGKKVNDKILHQLNMEATAYWNNCFALYEKYPDSNNFVYFWNKPNYLEESL